MGRKWTPQVINGGRPAKGGRKKAAPAKPTEPPDHLSELAKRAWRTFEPALRTMGAFHPDYGISLEQTCELYADAVELRKEITTQGRFYKTTNREGHVMIRPHPAAGQLADAERRLATYLAEFGLTPAGRARLLTTKKGKAQDDGKPTGDATEAFFA